MQIDGLTGSNTRVEKLNVDLTGAEGRYTLRRFSALYSQAHAELRGVIDLNQQQPVISFAGEAIAVPMTALMEDLGIDFDITGTLTVRGGLTARGADKDSLVATTDGSLAFALEDAVIKGAAYDVLATDFIDWMVSGAAREDHTKVDCTMASFGVRKGVARSDSLFMETRRMIATGEAKFDLPERLMDLTLIPKSKSRTIQIPASVRIKGSMDKPRVIASPVAAVADAYAEAIALVPRMVLRMFGIKKERGKPQPCEAEPN